MFVFHIKLIVFKQVLVIPFLYLLLTREVVFNNILLKDNNHRTFCFRKANEKIMFLST